MFIYKNLLPYSVVAEQAHILKRQIGLLHSLQCHMSYGFIRVYLCQNHLNVLHSTVVHSTVCYVPTSADRKSDGDLVMSLKLGQAAFLSLDA